ncbi:MAG: hypothetical protein JXA44_06735 [Methanospirillaceae archaeon]|nr:hypothetical protein [Methanospirillaceae archaeon]
MDKHILFSVHPDCIDPRQSGKTTLVRNLFPDKPYLLLEDPDTCSFVQEDPRSFLAQYQTSEAKIDEEQNVPELFRIFWVF